MVAIRQARITQRQSAFGATLPLLFTAAAIAAVGFAADVVGRARPLPATVEASPVPSNMSKRDEARLAAEFSAFALTKLAPERLVAEATPDGITGPTLPPLRIAAASPRADLKPQVRKLDRPLKPASVLPPSRSVVTIPAAAPLPAVVLVTAPSRGIVARVAEFVPPVPSPRQMVDGVWTLGGRVASYIPRI